MWKEFDLWIGGHNGVHPVWMWLPTIGEVLFFVAGCAVGVGALWLARKLWHR